jgi:calcium-dependent protein kinase
MNSNKVYNVLTKGFSQYDEQSLEDIFNNIDIDKSRSISFTEFIAASLDHKIYYKEDKLLAAFNIFDKNGNGKISLMEIKEILNVRKEDEKSIEYLFKSFDINDDGELDFNEFLILMGK